MSFVVPARILFQERKGKLLFQDHHCPKHISKPSRLSQSHQRKITLKYTYPNNSSSCIGWDLHLYNPPSPPKWKKGKKKSSASFLVPKKPIRTSGSNETGIQSLVTTRGSLVKPSPPRLCTIAILHQLGLSWNGDRCVVASKWMKITYLYNISILRNKMK